MIFDFQKELEYIYLGDIVSFVKSKISISEIDKCNYISTENMISDLGGIKTISNKPENIKVTEFLKDDILISNIRPYLKKIWFSDKNGGCSSDVLVLRINNEKILPKNLYYILSSDKFFNYMMKTSKGTKMPRGDKESILKFKVPIFSINMQKNQNNLLSTIDRKIELLEKTRIKFVKLNFELINKIMNQDYKIPNQKNIWDEITLKDIGNSYTGLSGKNKEDFDKGNAKYIPYNSVFNDIILDICNFENVDVKTYEKQNLVLKGDIFFTGSSETPEEVGMSSVLLEDIENCYLNSFCFGFRINSFENYNPVFLVYYFHSLKFKKQLFKLSQGSTRFNISKKELLKEKIEVPSKTEQDYYVNLLNNMFIKNKLINNEILYMKYFKKRLIEKMFV